MKEAIKNPKTSRIHQDFNLLTKQRYCLKCKKTEVENSKVTKINEVKLILCSKCALCDSKK